MACLIAIAGGPAAGKITLVRFLAHRSPQLCLVDLDSYTVPYESRKLLHRQAWPACRDQAYVLPRQAGTAACKPRPAGRPSHYAAHHAIRSVPLPVRYLLRLWSSAGTTVPNSTLPLGLLRWRAAMKRLAMALNCHRRAAYPYLEVLAETRT
jgi:hypothetical protein